VIDDVENKKSLQKCLNTQGFSQFVPDDMQRSWQRLCRPAIVRKNKTYRDQKDTQARISCGAQHLNIIFPEVELRTT